MARNDQRVCPHVLYPGPARTDEIFPERACPGLVPVISQDIKHSQRSAPE